MSPTAWLAVAVVAGALLAVGFGVAWWRDRRRARGLGELAEDLATAHVEETERAAESAVDAAEGAATSAVTAAREEADERVDNAAGDLADYIHGGGGSE